jgi:hypothetical protein
MTIRLYFDEDSMWSALLDGLHARGVDAITALNAGMVERSDTDHLDYATAQDRALCSFNVGDFYELHSQYLAAGKLHSGIIVARQQHYGVGEHMRRLLKLMAARTSANMACRIEFLSAWG